MIWGWFGWSNQTLSVFTLWAITVYMVRHRKPFVITFVPAIFMTAVCTTYLLSVKVFSIGAPYTYLIGVLSCIISATWFGLWYRKYSKN